MAANNIFDMKTDQFIKFLAEGNKFDAKQMVDKNEIDLKFGLLLTKIIIQQPTKALETFLDIGGNINDKDLDPNNTLFACFGAIIERTEKFKFLISRGANPFSRNSMYNSLLDTSAYYNDIHLSEYFISLGININYVSPHNGSSAIHYAARFRNLNLVKLLIIRDADVTIRNRYRLSPLDIAKQEGNPRIIEILEIAENNQQKRELTLERMIYLQTIIGESDTSHFPNYIMGPNYIWLRKTSNQLPIVLQARQKLLDYMSAHKRQREES